MRRFLQEFGRFTGNFEVSVKDGEGAIETERGGTPPQAWTMCMLLWLRVVKDSSLKDKVMEKWYDHVLSASEDELLSRLNSMLLKNQIQHRVYGLGLQEGICRSSVLDGSSCQEFHS